MEEEVQLKNENKKGRRRELQEEIRETKEDVMSKNSKLISKNLREEIAKELGVYDQVKKDAGSWASVSSRDCGNIVTKAIEIANRSVEKQL